MSTGRRDTPVRGRTPKVAGRRVAGRPSTSRPRTDPRVDPTTDAPTADPVAEVDETTVGEYTPVDLSEPADDTDTEAPRADTGDDLDGDDPDDPDGPDDRHRGAPGFSNRLSVVLLVVAVLVAAGGVFLWLRANDSGGTDDNVAVVDTGATVEVTTAVRDGLEKIFSYRYDANALTEDAAKTVLTGDAAGQYETLFAQVREQAPAQKLVLKSKVRSSGVSMLQGDRATLLVFLDQTATRGDTGAANTGGAQLSVSAQRVDGVWRISALVPR